jgi:hypothetical protein
MGLALTQAQLAVGVITTITGLLAVGVALFIGLFGRPPPGVTG